MIEKNETRRILTQKVDEFIAQLEFDLEDEEAVELEFLDWMEAQL